MEIWFDSAMWNSVGRIRIFSILVMEWIHLCFTVRLLWNHPYIVLCQSHSRCFALKKWTEKIPSNFRYSTLHHIEYLHETTVFFSPLFPPQFDAKQLTMSMVPISIWFILLKTMTSFSVRGENGTCRNPNGREMKISHNMITNT